MNPLRKPAKVPQLSPELYFWLLSLVKEPRTVEEFWASRGAKQLVERVRHEAQQQGNCDLETVPHVHLRQTPGPRRPRDDS